jgi:hypothetical protein
MPGSCPLFGDGALATTPVDEGIGYGEEKKAQHNDS